MYIHVHVTWNQTLTHTLYMYTVCTQQAKKHIKVFVAIIYTEGGRTVLEIVAWEPSLLSMLCARNWAWKASPFVLSMTLW